MADLIFSDLTAAQNVLGFESELQTVFTFLGSAAEPITFTLQCTVKLALCSWSPAAAQPTAQRTQFVLLLQLQDAVPLTRLRGKKLESCFCWIKQKWFLHQPECVILSFGFFFSIISLCYCDPGIKQSFSGEKKSFCYAKFKEGKLQDLDL